MIISQRESGEGKGGVDGGFLCVLTALMWEWREMQFSQIFAETESKMLKVILGREKLLIKETEAHFD